MTKSLAITILQRLIKMFHLVTMNQPLTPAQIVNQKYASNASVFISPEQRVNDYLNAVPGSKTELVEAIKYFKQANPNINVNNLELPIAHMIPLSDILIDDTMNRPLDWYHLINIVAEFDPVLVDGVRVYEDASLPGKYIAWDGQHTTLALYILFCLIFGKKPEDVMIPVTINRTRLKSAIRKTFIKHNSSTKKGGIKLELSPLDLYAQQVFGVRIDKSQDPNWIISEQKQTSLENSQLYLIDKGSYNSMISDGAITSPEKIIGEDAFIVEQFARYWNFRTALVGSSVVESKELVIISHLLHCFKNNGVTLTDTDFANMVAIFDKSFNIDFKSKSDIYTRVHKTFDNWYHKTFQLHKPYSYMTKEEKRAYPHRPDSLTVNSTEQTTHTVSYLASLMVAYKHKHPISGKPRIDIQYVPNQKDVY